MTKGSHKNTTRLTARERAITAAIKYGGSPPSEKLVALIQKAIQAAVRQALARDDRHDK